MDKGSRVYWNNSKELLSRFFAHYLWLGIVLVLVAVLIEEASQSNGILKRILVDVLSTVGIAVVVGAIFSFAAGTSEFLSWISDRLQNIVVSRKFLNNLDEKEKRAILRDILRPTDQQRDIYGNIESYYRHYIDRTMNVATSSVRSQYTCDCRVFFSPEDHALVAEYTNTYRLYPSQAGYKDITVGFYGEPGAAIGFEWIKLDFPDGTSKKFTSQDIDLLTRLPTGENEYLRSVPLQEIAASHPHVDVSLRLLQRGQDHWIQIGCQAMEPTDGFRFDVQCEEPLIIKEEATFIYGAVATKEPARVKNQGRATISCNQWIDQGAGVTVVIAVPHAIDKAIFDELSLRTHGARRDSNSTSWQAFGSAQAGRECSNSADGLTKSVEKPKVIDDSATPQSLDQQGDEENSNSADGLAKKKEKPKVVDDSTIPRSLDQQSDAAG